LARRKNDRPLTGQLLNPVKGKKQKDKGGGAKKYGRNRVKCAQYRNRVGKPNGRGKPGNKRGKQHVKN